MFRILNNNRGSWGIVAAASVAAIKVGSSAYAAHEAGKASSRVEGQQYPEFFEDPEFNEAQERLSGLGEDLLEGDVPDFYRDIGKQGGPTFEKFLNMTNADISKSVLESAAATGRSGGAVQSMTAEAVGKSSTKLRYQDYLNSVQGKKWLMEMGVDITSDVRKAGFDREAGRNEFNVGEAEYDFKQNKYLDESDILLGKMEGDAWGGVLNSISGIAGMFGGSWDGRSGGDGGDGTVTAANSRILNSGLISGIGSSLGGIS